MAGRWFTAAVRGLLAMAPPPPPSVGVATGIPCPGVPQSLFNSPPNPPLLCGPCSYDPAKSCSYVDLDADGNPDGDPLPVQYRGFDDPQADPASGSIFVQTTYVRYLRADLYSLPPVYTADDNLTGNPFWGSQPGDGDADGLSDALADRHNQGAYSAIYNSDRPQRDQQFPNDAFAEVSCPFPPMANPCDPYTVDCGGIALYNDAKPSGYDPYPGATDPPSQANWPVIPFPRDWAPYKSTDTDSVAAIKRLLRFSSAVVNYDQTAPHMSEYTLAEDARNVIVTAPGTPLAGALSDAYHYFVNSVFPQADDPAINCRSFIVVFLTDGLDECFSNPCVGGPTGKGPSGDLGAVVLPENPPGARAAAHAADPSIRLTGVPVFVIAMNTNPNDPRLKCIADNSGGQVFAANDRASIVAALQSILEFKRTANSLVAPAVPAFAGGFSDTAQLGAVIPSHTNEDGSASRWSIWSGSLKSLKLDSAGNIPVVTGVPPTATPTITSGGPPTPSPTPTPASVTTPVSTYADETDPNNVTAASRKPVWNAGRVLGFTDPAGVLTGGQAAVPANPPAKAPAISVWPGRKMVWATGAFPNIPLTRQEFLPDTGACSGGCFDSLATAMSLNPAVPASRLKARRTVQFLRGGVTAYGSRNEILNLPGIKPAGAAIGPNAGEQQRYSYFYQDDAPAPGEPPQFRTDGEATPHGYAHKLGDIFHSAPFILDRPRYFSYLAQDLTPRAGQSYTSFASLHSKRRRVSFVGANDGFLHAFDAGVWDRDPSFAGTFDLGTGREIFAYSPKPVLKSASKLIDFPPQPQYMVDGSMFTADVFIGTAHGGSPNNAQRTWRTVLVGTLRQGGRYVYALDVTQPDQVDAAGVKTAAKDSSPDCIDGGGTCSSKYPNVLWELTDSCVLDAATCLGVPAIGETWSTPVVGRIKLVNGVSYEDHYVAIFGGGNDPTYTPGSPLILAGANATKGRAIYVVDIETGKVLYKATQGQDSGAGPLVDFAP
ncbi:MAG TPA: PilC/PilY family type IV pilus protein, partial [Thermoanaerobaculia bacterium]